LTAILDLPENLQKIFFSRTVAQIEGKLHTNVPQAMGPSSYSQIIDITWSGCNIGLSENLKQILSLEPLHQLM